MSRFSAKQILQQSSFAFSTLDYSFNSGIMGQERDFLPRLSPEVAEMDYLVPISKRGRTPESSVYIILGILSSVICFFSAGNTGESARFAVRKPAEKRFYAFDEFGGRPVACSSERRGRSLLENVSLVIGSSLAFLIGSSQVSIGMSLFGIMAVLICFLMGSLQVRVSILQIVALVIGLHVRVLEHARGQSSSGQAGGSRAGNVGEERNGSRGERGDGSGAKVYALFANMNFDDCIKKEPRQPPACSFERRNIGSSQVSIGVSLFGITAVLIYLLIDSLPVRVSILQVVALVIGLHGRVKEHAQGQGSSGTAGGKGAGNGDEHRTGSRDGGDENGRIGRGINERRDSGIGGGEQRRGKDDDDDNDARQMVGNVENGRGRNPSLEQIANIFLPIIIQSIAIIMDIDDARLSTTGRAIRYLSTIINLLGFICCAAVLCQPYTNPRVASILNPRIAGILSRIGSALAVLGFISMMAINLPLHLSGVIGLAFLAVLAIFVVDFS